MRCLNRLRLIRQAAGNTAGAQEFRERFDAAEQALAATCSLPRDDTPDARAGIPALYAGTLSPGSVSCDGRRRGSDLTYACGHSLEGPQRVPGVAGNPARRHGSNCRTHRA